MSRKAEKQQPSDYKEYIGRLAKNILLGISIILGAAAFVIVVINVYFWIIYAISTHGVDQRIEQDRHNVPENIGG